MEKYAKALKGRKYDLVILDLGMPGMGGYSCLKKLKELDPEVKVIIASGYAYHAVGCMKSGARGFISKPYRLKELSKKVREVLDSPHPAT